MLHINVSRIKNIFDCHLGLSAGIFKKKENAHVYTIFKFQGTRSSRKRYVV